MNFVKPSYLISIIACLLLFPILGMSQQSHKEFTTFDQATILVGMLREDSTYLSVVNSEKKLSQAEKEQKVAEYKRQIAEFNVNLAEAIQYWNGENPLLLADSSTTEYKDYMSRLAAAKEEGVNGIKLYSIYYVSHSLSPAIIKKDPIFSEAHQPSVLLIERDLDAGTAKIVVMVLVSQGLPSAGLLGFFINTLNGQKIDTDKGITARDKDVFEERMKELKHKTLLIPKEFLSDKLSIESIKQIYPYAFEVLNEDEMNLKLQSVERDKCVIYQIIPQVVTTRGGSSPMGAVTLNLSKSAILFKSALFDVNSGLRMDVQEIKLALAGSSGTNELTKGELKDFVSLIEHP